MKRVLGHCLAGATLVVGGVAVMAACVHDDESLFVQNVLYPTPVAIGNSCTYSNDPNQTYLPRGILDVAFGRFRYDAWFLLGNELVQQSNPSTLHAESSTINVQGAVVRVTDAAGNQLTSFTSLTSGTVYAGTGTTPGYSSTSAQILDSATIQAEVNANAGTLTGGGTVKLVTYTKFFGHTLGGTYVESLEFEFPIDVCDSSGGHPCLVLFTSNDVDTTTPGVKVPNCLGNQSSSTSGGSSTLPVPCITGQDTTIDCSQCQGTPACSGAYAKGGAPVLDAGGGG